MLKKNPKWHRQMWMYGIHWFVYPNWRCYRSFFSETYDHTKTNIYLNTQMRLDTNVVLLYLQTSPGMWCVRTLIQITWNVSWKLPLFPLIPSELVSRIVGGIWMNECFVSSIGSHKTNVLNGERTSEIEKIYWILLKF